MPETWDNPFPMYSYTLGAISGRMTAMMLPWAPAKRIWPAWNKTITAMRIFEGKLYVSTGLNYKYGGQIWYTADGDTWR